MMEIFPAGERHLRDMMQIERACFSTPWSEESVRYEMGSPDAVVLAASLEGQTAGFAIVHVCAGEGELYHIAVREDFRRRGLGGALLSQALLKARQRGVRRMFLEVRRSNAPARALYARYGFAVCGERRNYYDAPREDAILMDAVLEGSGEYISD